MFCFDEIKDDCVHCHWTRQTKFRVSLYVCVGVPGGGGEPAEKKNPKAYEMSVLIRHTLFSRSNIKLQYDFLLYKVNNYMPPIHVSFCHTCQTCDNFKNLMLEALKVEVHNGLLRNVYYGGWMWREGVWFYFKATFAFHKLISKNAQMTT